MYNSERGLSLIGVVVAVFILSVGAIGVVQLSLKGQRTAVDSKTQFIATNLSREGLELARAVRDTAWFTLAGAPAGLEWTGDLCSGSTGNVLLSIEPSITNYVDIAANPSVEQQRLWRTVAGNFTHQSTGNTSTIYSRLIEVDCSEAAESIKLTSTVSWNEGTELKQVALESRLYNWYDRTQVVPPNTIREL